MTLVSTMNTILSTAPVRHGAQVRHAKPGPWALPNRRERRKLATRQTLLDATQALLAKRSFDALSVDEIVQRADVARGTFYNYFADKDALERESRRSFGRASKVRSRARTKESAIRHSESRAHSCAAPPSPRRAGTGGRNDAVVSARDRSRDADQFGVRGDVTEGLRKADRGVVPRRRGRLHRWGVHGRGESSLGSLIWPCRYICRRLGAIMLHGLGISRSQAERIMAHAIQSVLRDRESDMGIKIQDIAYVRFNAPDLDEMETFLVDFGMVRAERTGDALYMRGLDGDPFVHVTHRGEPRFVAAGFEAASMKDLETLAREKKASLVPLDGPGGGSLLRLTDPNGFQIEVVAGREQAARVDAPAREPFNDAYATPRLNALKRLSKGPSHVKRLGHCVLNVNNFRESEAWYKSHFGLITSDEINLGLRSRRSAHFYDVTAADSQRPSHNVSARHRQAWIQSCSVRSNGFRRSHVRS